jgi:hypothetical protein
LSGRISAAAQRRESVSIGICAASLALAGQPRQLRGLRAVVAPLRRRALVDRAPYLRRTGEPQNLLSATERVSSMSTLME